MKQIVAYIRPSKLPGVTLALQRIDGLLGMSFSEVRELGHFQPPATDPPIVRDLVDYVPCVRLEIFCTEDLMYETQCAIETAAHTGPNGAGEIYVLNVGQAIRFQSDGRGEAVPANGVAAPVSWSPERYA